MLPAITHRIVLFLLVLLLLTQAQGQRWGGHVAARIQALQDRGVAFTHVGLVQELQVDDRTTARWQEATARATVLSLHAEAVTQVLRGAAHTMAVTLPTPDGPLTLELERWQPLADGFTVTTALRGAMQVEPGVHYRGRVRGEAASVAGLSVFDDELIGVVRDAQGTLVLGRLNGAEAGMHVVYREHDLRLHRPMTCGTTHDGDPYHASELQGDPDDRSIRCVKFYWEVDHPIFVDKGGVVAATNYVTGLFNQSAILFDNDGVDVQLQEVFVWDVTSPYTGPSTSNYLNQFGAYRTSFNGDLAHLLGYSGNGGIAWINSLCGGTSSRMAYSDINSSYSNVPTYSWSVEVVTHEQGHNLGSAHTHACVWNGNGTAIDGCGPTAGYTEGSCATGPLPTGGGTIMSYCHLVGGVGINFTNGFGPQPAAVIRNRVNASACLAQCGSTCDPPGTLSVTNLTSNAATLSWSNLGVAAYTLRWKPQVAPTWTTIPGLTTTTYALTGLSQTTAYEFQVQSDCGASTSAFSASTVFTTPAPCPDALEPNETFATAAQVALPANISALIATTSDADHYGFSIAATSTITIFLSGLPANYNVRLLGSGGNQLALAQNSGTNSEFISYANAAAGAYVVHVFGANGASDPVACYSLSIAAQASTCDRPLSQSVTSITYNSAILNWAVVQGASAYDVQWKESAAPAWTLVTGVTGTSLPLTGLSWGTAHQFQVRTVCQGTVGGQGGTSLWSQPTSFTTGTPPCEVAPPTVLAATVLLDGAWRSAANLMVDSLRRQGVLPLTEPYSAAGHLLTGATTTTAQVLAVTGANAITDWVLVELRSATTPAQVLEARAALVQRDGDVVAVDGTSPLGFCLAAGSYHVAVRHRNHLGVMTAQPIALSGTATALDLSVATTATWGANARKSANGRTLLWSGNVVGDAQVKYTGGSNDRDPILTLIGGTVPTATVPGYHAADVTLDGQVKYTGTGNDRDPILSNVGGTVPTATVVQQLP
ncbi:MAG: fibronectin type III domain-containing protein [Flavobacteriales bacterium]|nr:fibronectin type III domain-containing protein [Flavobacteriales bacterium]